MAGKYQHRLETIACSAFTPQVAAILTSPKTTWARTDVTTTQNATATVPALEISGAGELATVLLAKKAATVTNRGTTMAQTDVTTTLNARATATALTMAGARDPPAAEWEAFGASPIVTTIRYSR